MCAVDDSRARVALQEDPDKEATVPQRSRLPILISGRGVVVSNLPVWLQYQNLEFLPVVHSRHVGQVSSASALFPKTRTPNSDSPAPTPDGKYFISRLSLSCTRGAGPGGMVVSNLPGCFQPSCLASVPKFGIFASCT